MIMSIRIGKVELIGIQEAYTEETRSLVEQRVPDQQGSVFQDLGREPVTVVLEGFLFGPEVLPDLEKLRQAQEKAEPLPLAADISAGTELTDVITMTSGLRSVRIGNKPSTSSITFTFASKSPSSPRESVYLTCTKKKS